MQDQPSTASKVRFDCSQTDQDGVTQNLDCVDNRDSNRSVRFSASSKRGFSTVINRLDEQTSEELNNDYPMVANLVSFGVQKSLLRAIKLTSVMRGCAAVLNGNKGSEQTYSLSEPVQEIHTFISHNWSVSRALKFLCLAVHFNFRRAIVVEMFVTAAVVAANDADLLPRVAGSGVFAHFLVAPIFLIFVFFGHSIQFCSRSPALFLDKTCIHQVDMKLQQEGIMKLGAFLRSSRHMLVIYTDVYLTKLWTVYEVACFLSLHSTGHMTVMPVHLPLMILGGVALVYMFTVVNFVLMVALNIADAFYIGFFLGMVPLAKILRSWARAKGKIRDGMDSFMVENCKCYQEEDRPVVYHNISLLMRATGAVDAEGTDEDTRDAFNNLVRERLPGAFAASTGRFAFGYWHVVAMFLANFAKYLEMKPAGQDWLGSEHLGYVLYLVAWVFGLYPLGVAFIGWWSGLCLHLQGWREWLFLGCWFLIEAVLFGAVNLVHEFCYRSSHQATSMVGLVLFTFFSPPLAYVAFNVQQESTVFLNEEQPESEQDDERDAAGVPAEVRASLEQIGVRACHVRQWDDGLEIF